MIAIIFVALLATALGQSCQEDSYIADSKQCDRYVECKDGVATEILCPDGLVFNDLVKYGVYPCYYPTEVDCSSRSQLQPAQSTQFCGRAWGYFGSGDSSICELFYNCVDGIEHVFTCPEGLAFSSASYRCDWPEQSADCDVQAYLGFSCPTGTARDDSQFLTVGTPRYASPRDCRKYFLCIDVAPRLQTCELGKVFNEAIHACDEQENVSGCQDYYPREELAAIRARKEQRLLEQEQRVAALRARLATLRSNGGSAGQESGLRRGNHNRFF